MKRIFILFGILVAGMTMLSLPSCKDDNDGGGQPRIDCVRTTDPELADSTFTDASVGQMILIEGVNLENAVHVYINDQDVYFNTNYNTSTHIILTIPSDLIVRGMDDSLPLEIRVETTHGSAAYAFHVIAGTPSLELYKADLPLNSQGIPEMVPGQEVTLVGELLHEIEHIYVADLDTVPLYEVTDYTLNADRTEIRLRMPSNPIPDYGIYMVECYAGNAYCGFSRSPMEPEVYDVFPDMPIPGQQVTVVGKYLTNLTALNLGGEIDIDIDEVIGNESMTSLTFTMPAQLPTKDANGMMSVTTLGGKATLPFYRYDWIYEDFDGNGTSMWWQWGTNATWGDGIPDSCPITVSSGKFLYFEGPNTGWWNNENVHAKSFPEAIDPATPLSNVELRYEVYLQEDVELTTNITLCGVTVGAQVADHVQGKVMPGQWMSVVIPMTQFGPSFATWGDLIATDVLDSDNFKIYHDTSSGEKMHNGYDNFRFYIKSNQQQ